MVEIRTVDKWVAIDRMINQWLKDPTYYCNHCGNDYITCCSRSHLVDVQIGDTIHTKCMTCGAYVVSCCENPQIGTNKDHCYALIKQNKEMTKIRQNKYASTKDKTWRWGVSLPPRLYFVLNKYCKEHNDKLFEKPEDLNTFMRKYKQFRIPEEI